MKEIVDVFSARQARLTAGFPRRGVVLAGLAWILSPLAVEAFPEIIIKADDLRYSAATTVTPQWQRFVDFIEERRISASIGIITDSLENAGEDYYTWIRDTQRRGRIEFWNHGYQHSRDSGTPTAWWEFRNTTYEEQKNHFEWGQVLAREKLGFPFRTFGAPYNQTDATTVQVLEENADLRVWLYGDSGAGSSKLVLERYGSVNIEIATGTPDFAAFEANFPTYADKPVITIQGHPGQWDDADWVEFEKIIDYIEDQGSTFTTPFAYYRKVNQIPYVIIKADNVEYEIGAGQPNAPWQRFIDFLRARNLKATAGLRGDTLETVAGVDKTPYYDWLKDLVGDETIEYFLYGYDHSRDQANSPPLWWEFRHTDYEFQKYHFTRVADLAAEKLGVTLQAFGASWNQTDATTVRVLEEAPEVKVWLYGDAQAETTKLVLPRIPEVNIEQPVHEPNLSSFEAHYPLYKDRDVLVIQGHPADWDTDAAFAEFVGIIDYLEAQGVVFVTPSEYYEIVNPAGLFSFELELRSAAGTRYQWERSEDMVTWERFGERFFGDGEIQRLPVVYRGTPPVLFFRSGIVPADEPLYENAFDDLAAFNDLQPGVASDEAGVVLVDATTTPVNRAGAGSGMRFYDLSTSAGVRAFDDVALPAAFKLEITVFNNRYETENTFQGPTLRFGNAGAGLQSSANTAFYLNFRKDDYIRAYHAGGFDERLVTPDEPHTVTLYVNSAMEGSITYEGPLSTRTLGPMSYDVYVDEVRLGTSETGLLFVNPSGYTPAGGIGRFGFNTSSTHTGADFTFDDLSISPLP